MSEIYNPPYGTWAEIMRDAGFWPRPLLGKACKIPGWQKPDEEWDRVSIEKWAEMYPQHNIGLLMGSPLPDGTLLGALDIDHDDYVALGKAVLRNPPCGRIGKKGAVYFVRYEPTLKNAKIRVKGDSDYGQVLECLFNKCICVIPPSIHPDTQQPYRWIDTPLHEMDFQQLPLIGE